MADLDWRAMNVGIGPGVITPDGCAVEFYSILPAEIKAEIIDAATGSVPSSILELGAGTELAPSGAAESKSRATTGDT